MVAKSYQSYIQKCEPYEKNGRMYVKIEHPSTHHERECRWYTEEEYARLYPGTITKSKSGEKMRSYKEVMGFKDGYITIFKGDTYTEKDWFQLSKARYNTLWGWHFPSETPLPKDIPEGVKPIKLEWEKVSKKGLDELLPDPVVKSIVEDMIYEPTESKYQGAIGDRIDKTLTIQKAIALEAGSYGPSTMHIMMDTDKNVYVWTTAAKTLIEGKTYQVKGTIKDHKKYHNSEQTILTRCRVS